MMDMWISLVLFYPGIIEVLCQN